MPYSVLFYEPEQAADGIRQVQSLNKFGNITVIQGRAKPSSLIQWAANVPHIDLLDINIQGAEAVLVPQIMDPIQSKVKRLIVGVHSPDIEMQMMSLFSSWRVVSLLPYTNNLELIENKFHAKREFDGLLATPGMYTDTEYGPVVQWDGELVVDNPAFDAKRRTAEYVRNCML